jgi:hypothetical protein
MRPALIEHRMQVEVELRKASKGTWPPPHIVMDKLLQMTTHPVVGDEFGFNDQVIQNF